MTPMSDPAVSAFSRRRFLNASGGAIITAATSLRAQQKADSNETLKIGLVGCGGRGNLSTADRAEIVNFVVPGARPLQRVR